MKGYIKGPHTSIFTGQIRCGKTYLVLELIEKKNTINILTTSLSSVQHFKKIIEPIIITSGSRMLIMFGL